VQTEPFDRGTADQEPSHRQIGMVVAHVGLAPINHDAFAIVPFDRVDRMKIEMQ